MCFSATASFLAAGVTGAIAIATIARARGPRELPLAAAPLFFAVQQGLEGLLWLHLTATPPHWASIPLTYSFLLLAQVFWPIYAPLTVWLVEPSPQRRIWVAMCAAVGVAVATDLLWGMLGEPQAAVVRDGHIVYAADPQHSGVVGLSYLIPTAVAPALSSHRTVTTLGFILLVGSVVAYVFYWEAFVSVWCFFAATASGVILFHFEAARRHYAQAMHS